MTELPQGFLEKLEKLILPLTPRILVVSVSDQKLIVFEERQTKSEHLISTAQKGTGQKVNTYQTPLGLHRIKEKIGKGHPAGAVFESRVFRGEIWVPPPTLSSTKAPPGVSLQTVPVQETDLITSRILWLEGLEHGFNAGTDSNGFLVDSYQRYIYIHGTNHEQEIGKPSSRGCIRMTNSAVIELFDQVEEGDLVWIQE